MDNILDVASLTVLLNQFLFNWDLIHTPTETTATQTTQL